MTARIHAEPRAPFALGKSHAIDPDIANRLLTVALAQGGDYADLFFEYQASGGLTFEEGITRSASRGVSVGLGVRVLSGDATGYAYVEDLEFEAMRRAAETAARIARSGGSRVPERITVRDLPSRYALSEPTIDQPGPLKRAILERAAARALSFDRR